MPSLRCSVRLSRRNLLTGAAAAAFTSLLGAGSVSARDPRPGRPFTIDDFLRQQDVTDIVSNPQGMMVALQVQRRSVDGGFYAKSDYTVTPRCDIYLTDPEFRSVQSITRGEDWFHCPAFSPDGASVAMMMVNRNGEVGLAIRRPGQAWAARIAPALRISPAVTLVSPAPRMMSIAWIDDRYLLAVEQVSDYTPRSISDLRIGERSAEAAETSVQGGLSVRTWRADDPQTCSAANRLVKVDSISGAVAILLEGDIRTASVSPDGRYVAAVAATARLLELPRNRMPPPIGWAGGYEDTLVELDLHVVDLAKGALVPVSPGLRAVGSLQADSGPIWAADSTRFALQTRAAYSSELDRNEVSLCVLGEGRVVRESFPAPSPLDAVAAAHIAAASSNVSEARARIGALPRLGPAGLARPNIGGQVASTGSTVVVSDGASLRIFRPKEPAAGVILSGQLDGIFQRAADGEIWCILKNGDGRARIKIGPDGQRTEPAATPPLMTTASLLLPTTGRQIFVEQGDSDTRVVRETSDRGLENTRFRLNTHFASVRRPEERLLPYRGSSGEPLNGVLYMPTNDRRDSDPLAVIVTAYPRLVPRLDGRYSRPNSSASWMHHSLLGAGFAVFHAAFPSPAGTEANAPMRLVRDAILPALSALDTLPEMAERRYGFYGHSNGGYAALALGAQTDRFKAIVADAPFPDSFHVDFPLTPELRLLDCAPGVIQTRRFYLEGPNVPYAYAANPADNPQRFIENSPLYNLAQYRTPTLMLYGENDTSLVPVEKMFLALQMKGVDVELDTYRGEGHVLQSPANIRHATERVIGWFDRHLRA